MGELIDDDVLDAFAVVCPLDQVAAEVRDRFGGMVDRFSFYAPYKVDPEAWKDVLAGLPRLRPRTARRLPRPYLRRRR